jgi:hypothetical protein
MDHDGHPGATRVPAEYQQGANWGPAGASRMPVTRKQPPVPRCKQTATSSQLLLYGALGRWGAKNNEKREAVVIFGVLGSKNFQELLLKTFTNVKLSSFSGTLGEDGRR